MGNVNTNIQNISIEQREPNIVVIIRGGAVTRGDQEAPYGQPRVWPTPPTKVPFDVHKEKEVLFYTQHEFVDTNKASTSVVFPISSEGPILEMPQWFE